MSSLSHLISKMVCFVSGSSPVGNKKWQEINSAARVANCINNLPDAFSGGKEENDKFSHHHSRLIKNFHADTGFMPERFFLNSRSYNN